MTARGPSMATAWARPSATRPARSGARPDARRPDGGRRSAGGRLVVGRLAVGPARGRAGAVPVGAAGRGLRRGLAALALLLLLHRARLHPAARGLGAVRGADRAGRRHAGLSRGVRRLSAGAGRRSPPAGRAYRAGERGAGGRGVCVRTGHADLGILHQRALLPHRRGRAGLALRAAGGGGRLRAGLCLLEHAVPVADPAGAGDLAAASSGLWRLGAAAMRGAGGAGVGARACRGRTSPRAMPATPRPMRGRSRCGCAGPPPQAGWPWPSSP